MKPILYFIVTLLFFACKQEKKEVIIDQAEVEWQAIKDTTDYKTLLVYLNKFPESRHFDTAIIRYLDFYNKYEPPISCCYNCKSFYVNDEGEIMFSDNVISIDSVNTYTFNYFYIDDEYAFPSYRKFNNEYNKLYRAEIIRLTFNPWHLYDVQQCFIEVRKGIIQYRDSLVRSWYDKDFHELDSLKQTSINSIFETRVRPEKYRPIPPPPSPPLPNEPEFFKMIEEE